MGRDPDTTVQRWLASPSGTDSGREFPCALIIASTQLDDEVLLLVAGEVDHFSVGSLVERLGEALTAGARRAVLDISGMAFVDGAGLGALVGATRRFRNDGGDLVLVGARSAFVQLVDLLDLGRSLRLGSRKGARER